ncbi:MAG TPA: hypothetical protein VGE35_03690 [Candidatus Paceibacterota bacterium]
MKTKLRFLSVLIGSLAYLHLVIMTARGTGEGLSLTTFALWSALAWITSITMYKQKVSPVVPAIFATGATATTAVLLAKGRYGWTGFDTLIAILVFLCVVLWMTKGPMWALVLSVVAAVIAAVPFIVMSWQSPATIPIIANSGFLITNVLAFASAKEWTLKDRLYSGANIIVCLLLVLPWFLNR